MKSKTTIPSEVISACMAAIPLEEWNAIELYRFYSFFLGSSRCSMALWSGEKTRLWGSLAGHFTANFALDEENPNFMIGDEICRLHIRILPKEHQVLGQVETRLWDGNWNFSPWLDLLYGHLPMSCFCGVNVKGPGAACRWNPIVPGTLSDPGSNCWAKDFGPKQCLTKDDPQILIYLK